VAAEEAPLLVREELVQVRLDRRPLLAPQPGGRGLHSFTFKLINLGRFVTDRLRDAIKHIPNNVEPGIQGV
jgi:hypothetical protein